MNQAQLDMAQFDLEKRIYQFGVVTKARTYVLVADEQEDAESWIKMLSLEIAAASIPYEPEEKKWRDRSIFIIFLIRIVLYERMKDEKAQM